MNQFNFPNHYVDGQWRTPLAGRNHAVINPATEAEEGSIQLGSAADVDRAVAAAKKAFESYSVSTIAERKALLASVVEVYERRYDDIALAISTEMGAPLEQLAKPAQAGAGIAHLNQTIALLDTFNFESDKGEGRLMREPVGVCALITPWNWPINQITCKVAPALAAGCTMVLKPSEVAPLSAHIFAEILDEAGVPAGVFNLVDGDGPTVGAALSAHHDIDMVSFTGSTRAGTAISRAAADTVKRVSLELGGKSANVVLDDCNLEEAITRSVLHMMNNTGQSCNAPSRMLVPKTLLEQAEQIAADACASLTVGNPNDKATTTGPLSSEMQFNKVQSLIEKGIEEGAKLVCGGPGRPNGLDSGYYAQPTVFSDVNNQMTIALSLR